MIKIAHSLLRALYQNWRLTSQKPPFMWLGGWLWSLKVAMDSLWRNTFCLYMVQVVMWTAGMMGTLCTFCLNEQMKIISNTLGVWFTFLNLYLWFWRYMRKTTVWPLCSIFSSGGHVFPGIKNPQQQFYAGYPKKIHTKFGSDWSSSVHFWTQLYTNVGK